MDSITNAIMEFAECVLWEGFSHDYCIQLPFDGDAIVFGSVNRVVWKLTSGWAISPMHCTAKFIEHYKEMCNTWRIPYREF